MLNRLVDQGIAERVAPMGEKLRTALGDAFEDHPHLGDIRGRGLFIGIELVEDRDTKTPFDPSLKIQDGIKARCFEAGLICYPMGGTIDGKRGNHILLAPPFIMEETHIGLMVDALNTAIAPDALRG